MVFGALHTHLMYLVQLISKSCTQQDTKQFHYCCMSYKGESWLGLDKLHAITTSNNFGLKVIIGDYDGTSLHGIWDFFQVRFDLNQR